MGVDPIIALRNDLIRGASPLGLPDTRSRAPLRRRAPIAWLTRTLARAINEMASRCHTGGLLIT